MVKLEISKFWLHYGAAIIDKFSKGAVHKKSLVTAGLADKKSDEEKILNKAQTSVRIAVHMHKLVMKVQLFMAVLKRETFSEKDLGFLKS